MDRAISHEPSSNSEQAADLVILAQDLDFNRAARDPCPSRPPSRLSYNTTQLATCSSNAPPDSEASQWSRSLFQNVGIPELRLSSIKQSKMDAIQPSLSHNTSEEDAAGEAMRRAAPRESPASEPAPLAAPRKSPSVSRLSFPFVTTPSPRRNKPQPSPPPTRHKYSCFPSLMCPTPAGRPFPVHQRHSYPQHGYSRTALQNLKWFWSTRQEALDGSTVQSPTTDAYDGVVQDAITGQAPLQQALTPNLQQENHMECVYPRRGDISALRDPYCADIDRYFAGLPMWTINKTLWMHDMHMATQNSKPALQLTVDESSDDDDEDGEMESLFSAHCGDDSDATLVESESEADLSDTPHNQVSLFDMVPKAKLRTDDLHQNGKVGPSSTVVYANASASKRTDGPLGIDRTTWSQSANINQKTPNELSRWPTDWYRRWEVLVELSQRSRARSLSDASGSLIYSSNPRRPVS